MAIDNIIKKIKESFGGPKASRVEDSAIKSSRRVVHAYNQCMYAHRNKENGLPTYDNPDCVLLFKVASKVCFPKKKVENKT